MYKAIFAALALGSAAFVAAAPRIDNVLEKMVPPGTVALAGIHFDQLRQTEMYRHLPPALTERLDGFPWTTAGFDPRRDIREALYVSTPNGSVLLARGAFPVKQTQFPGGEQKRHGQYTIWTEGHTSFCILDATLAVAGETAAVEAVLDEWTSGTHTAAQALLAGAGLVAPESQVWGISANLAASFAAGLLQGGRSNGFAFSDALEGLGECWFEANVTAGIHMELHGVTANEAKAINLRDALRGAVGLGRLNVPEDQPELLRVWDGIVVEQKGRAIAVRADIPRNLADRLFSSPVSPDRQTAGGQKRRVL